MCFAGEYQKIGFLIHAFFFQRNFMKLNAFVLWERWKTIRFIFEKENTYSIIFGYNGYITNLKSGSVL